MADTDATYLARTQTILTSVLQAGSWAEEEIKGQGKETCCCLVAVLQRGPQFALLLASDPVAPVGLGWADSLRQIAHPKGLTVVLAMAD